MQYWQIAFALSCLPILSDVVTILRAHLVNTTFIGTTASATEPDDESGRSERTAPVGPPKLEEARVHARLLYRWVCTVVLLISWAPVAMAIVAGVQYPKATRDSSTAHRVYGHRFVILRQATYTNLTMLAVTVYRYAATVMILCQLLAVQGFTIWCYLRVPLIRRGGIVLLLWIITLLVRVCMRASRSTSNALPFVTGRHFCVSARYHT